MSWFTTLLDYLFPLWDYIHIKPKSDGRVFIFNVIDVNMAMEALQKRGWVSDSRLPPVGYNQVAVLAPKGSSEEVLMNDLTDFSIQPWFKSYYIDYIVLCD